MRRIATVAACLAVALCAAAPLAPPEASARKKLSLKQKKAKCLKAAAHKRSRTSRRRAARRCRKKYAARRPAAKRPAPPPVTAPPAAPGTATPASPVLSRYVSVTAREFSLTLSRPLVGAGQVTIELRNYGEDPHDLVVERSGAEVGRWGELGPGAVSAKKVTLGPGSYKLFCAIEGHEQIGMKATLKVQG